MNTNKNNLSVNITTLFILVALSSTCLSLPQNVTISYGEITNTNRPVGDAQEKRLVACSVLNPLVFRGNYSVQDKCCRILHKTFLKKWRKVDHKLGEWLNLLKLWNCSQFREECESPTFYFNEFTNTLYKRFCDAQQFEEQCKEKVKFGTIKNDLSDEGSGVDPDGNLPNAHNKSIIDESALKISLPKDLTLNKMLDPCVQSSLVDIGSVKRQEQYFELKVGDLPFCEIVWCALPAEVFLTETISVSVCMPTRCKVNMYVFMAFAGLLSLAIVGTNLTVLIVFSRKKQAINSQRLYKISLAVADLFVGLIVVPTMISTIYESFNFQHEIVEEVDEYGRTVTTITDVLSSYEFLGVSGFFTTLSLSVSIYTLMVASFDRLMVVYKPLEYNKFRAISMAKVSIGLVWTLCLVFSLLPFVIDGLFYTFIASVVVLLGGSQALIVYSIIMVIPLLIVWGTNIATLLLFKRNAGEARMPASNAQINPNKAENQLVKTLSIMVGVFTLCLIPLVLLTISQFFVSGIYLTDPKNFNQTTSSIMMSFEAATVLMLMSNSLWNIFIYNGRSAEFREDSRELYKSLFFKIQKRLCCCNIQPKQKKSPQKNTISTSNSNEQTMSTAVQNSSAQSNSTA